MPGIACVGWGSLVYDPRTLPRRGLWHDDGPLLPIEFARESGERDGERRVTLVICPEGAYVRTLWALLEAPDVQSARQALGVREYKDAKLPWIEKNIGFWDRASGTSFGLEQGAIAAWAQALRLDGTVWTSLPHGFRKGRGTMPTGQQVVDYLRTLNAADSPGAEAYVRRAPEQIDTPYRRLIAEQLGWRYHPGRV